MCQVIESKAIIFEFFRLTVYKIQNNTYKYFLSQIFASSTRTVNKKHLIKKFVILASPKRFKHT